MLNPIAPHWTEYCYKKYLNPIFHKLNKNLVVDGLLSNGRYPAHQQVNLKLIKINKYVKGILRKTNESIDKFRTKNGNVPANANFVICENYQDSQVKVFNVLSQLKFDENFKLLEPFKGPIIKGLNLSEDKNKKELSSALQFAAFIVKEAEKYGRDALEHSLPFKEIEALNEYKSYILQMTKLKEVTISIGKNEKELGGATPGSPNIVISFADSENKGSANNNNNNNPSKQTFSSVSVGSSYYMNVSASRSEIHIMSRYRYPVVTQCSSNVTTTSVKTEEKSIHKQEKHQQESNKPQKQNKNNEKGEKPQHKQENPKPEETKPQVTPSATADECDNLFDDDNEDDKKKLEELAAKKKKEKEDKDKKDKDAKPALIAKSIVLLDVKVFEIEQDLDVLAKKIIREIVKEGLVWKTEYQLLDVAFGIRKIRIGCVVEDEKVSVDDLIDDIQAWEEEVQSVDIVSFNKL